MSKNKENIKALLIQIRLHKSVKEEELASFALYAGIKAQQITVFDVFNQNCNRPFFKADELKEFDVIFIGGASDASVSDRESYPFVTDLIEFIKLSIEFKIPVFASCFGFQVAVLALGGSIIRDSDDFEMGTYQMSLTNSALKDPIFRDIPDKFYAVSVHQEKALSLPDSCELLAFTDSCVHSFKVKSAPFWAFQFHPELNKQTLKDRLTTYKEKYTEDARDFERVIGDLEETPYSNQLVTNFIDFFYQNFKT